MRIGEKNFSVYFGNEEKVSNEQEKQGKNIKSVFGGNFSDPVGERVTQKREAARKQAAKVLRDQFAMDEEIADSIEERRSRKSELLEERAEIRNSKAEAEKQLEALMEQNPASEAEQKELDEKILEQQKAVLGYGFADWQKGEEIRGVDIAIRQTKINMLQLDGMVKASKNADTIMENASEQIVGMLMQESKEHVDKEFQEKVEQAQEKAEEKEAQEEQLEKTKEKREEAEALTEVIQESSSAQVKIDQELKEIMKESELLEEEIKGLIVDSGV